MMKKVEARVILQPIVFFISTTTIRAYLGRLSSGYRLIYHYHTVLYMSALLSMDSYDFTPRLGRLSLQGEQG